MRERWQRRGERCATAQVEPIRWLQWTKIEQEVRFGEARRRRRRSWEAAPERGSRRSIREEERKDELTLSLFFSQCKNVSESAV